MSTYKSLLLISVFVVACNSSQKKNRDRQNDSTSFSQKDSTKAPSNYQKLTFDDYIETKTVSAGEVQEISESCALIISPTDDQIEQMKKEYGEDDFYTVADDATFYQGTARKIIDSLGVKTIDANKSLVKFNGSQQKSWTLTIRRKYAPEWNIILFHKEKQPEIVTPIDATGEKVKKYFGLN